MSDDKKPSPQDQLREGIKSVVNAANVGLAKTQESLESLKQPLSASFHTVQETGATAITSVKYVYQRRHEYAPEINGGSAVTTGGYLLVKRGRIAGLLGVAVGAGAAYAVVYDEFSLEKVPNIIFGKK